MRIVEDDRASAPALRDEALTLLHLPSMRAASSRRGRALWLGASLPKSTRGWLSLTFLALGPGAVAAVSQSYSMPRLGAATYAIIAYGELVRVVVVRAVVLGEKLTPTHVLGGGLILAGIFLHGWARRAARD